MTGYLLGIDIGGTKLAMATARPGGAEQLRSTVDTDADRGAAAVLSRCVAAARELMDRTPGHCRALGVVCPGIVRADGIDLAPNIPGWGGVRLVDELRAGLGVAGIAVGNDVKAAGLAEARDGVLVGADPGLYLSLGTGIAAAIVHDGQVLAGAHGAAGEFGYNLPGVATTVGAADGRSPLEERVGGRGIGRRATAELGVPVSAADLFARTDPAARRLVDAVLDELAVHVANLTIAIDPCRVAVGGGLTGDDPERILAALRHRLERAAPFPPELVPARYRRDGALVGALILAADLAARPDDGSRA